MSKRIKGMISKVLVAALAITPVSVWAEGTKIQPTVPSAWAMDAFVDSEAYGALPVDFSKGLHTPVTEENFAYILKGVELKMEALGLSKVETPHKIDASKELTRESVLIKLYNQLLRYESSEKLGLENKDAIEWMQSKGIVQGKDNGLDLADQCTLEEALTFATRLIENEYKGSDKGARGLIWEATNGENKVYLLGTIHVGQSILYPIHESLDKALQDSDAVAFEVDFNNQSEMGYLLEQQKFTDGTTLDEHVSKEAYTKTVELMGQLGLTEEQVKQYKPITLTNIMTMASTKEETTSELALPILDIYFQSKTHVQGKELIELEGMRYQTDFLYNAPMDTQVFMLEEAVKGINEGEKDKKDTPTTGDVIGEWVKLWAEGNEEEFAKVFPKNQETGVEMVDNFNEELFGKRDKNMTNKVVEMLNNKEGKTYMVVVGAGHMTGETGIVAGLKELGYNVTAYNE